jgi:DNA-binding GntR family transcriptional regulator
MTDLDFRRLAERFKQRTGDSPQFRPLQLAHYLDGLIKDGTLPAGWRFPGERHLTTELGVSLRTLRQAFRTLRDLGSVVARTGDGTFVATPPDTPNWPSDRAVQQLVTLITEQITSGNLRPGQRIPDERSLAQQHDLHVTFVRRALAQLCADKLLVRNHAGTFVHHAPAYAHERVTADLTRRITQGTISGPLPSERTLMRDYGTSSKTIRRSLATLREQGLVYTIPGKGTFPH